MRNQSNSKDKGTNWIILFIALFIEIRISSTINIDNLPFIFKFAIQFLVVIISYKCIDSVYNFIRRKSIKK